MSQRTRKIILTLIVLGALSPLTVFAARTDIGWVNESGTVFIKPNWMPNGMDLLIYGSNHYINFNTITGASGYGFRDNAGQMEFKNSGGSWTGIGTGGGGGGGVATSSLTATYPIVITTSVSAINFSTALTTTSPQTWAGLQTFLQGFISNASSSASEMNIGKSTTTEATSTNSYATTASSTNLFTSNFTLGRVSGFLKATAGVVATALIDLTTDVTAVLPVTNGGTGWAALQANTILLGNGTGAVATTSAGTNGFVLGLVAGVPTWVATTTLTTISGTLGTTQGGTNITSYTTGDTLYASNTNVLSKLAASTNGFVMALSDGIPSWVASTTLATISGTLNLATQVSGILTVPNGGTGWGAIQSNAIVLGNGTGAVATTSAGTNGFTLALVNGVPTWQATTTLANISGTLGVTSGGTGLTSIATGDILYGSNTNILSARSAGTNGFVLAMIGGVPAWVATTTLATISGQLDLTTQVTGDLPFANLAQVSANSLLGNNTSATADARSVSTSTLYGTCTGGQVVGWSNIISGLGCIATSSSAGGTPGGSNGQLQFNDASSFGGAVTSFFNKATGRLGLGTTTPVLGTLTVGSSTEPQILLTDNSLTNNSFFLRVINNNLYVGTSSPAGATSSNPIIALINNASSPVGSIGIGTSTPNSSFIVNISNAASSVGAILINTITNVTNALTIRGADGTTRFNIDTTPNYAWLGIGTSTPWATNVNVALSVVNPPLGTGVNATTTMLLGDTSTTTSRSGIQMNTDAGATVCLYVHSTSLVVQSGVCN